jgi:hypothetical protein
MKSVSTIDLSGISCLRGLRGSVTYLEALGYKVYYSKLRDDSLNGRLERDPKSGKFTESSLKEYAGKYLVMEGSKGGLKTREAEAKAARMESDAKLKRIMAERNQLKLDVERGLVIEVGKYEQALAARMAFFKNEVEVLGSAVVDAMVERFGVGSGRKEEILTWWGEATAGWLDAFSKDREFTVDLDLEAITPGLLYGGKRLLGHMRGNKVRSGAEEILAGAAQAKVGGKAKASPKAGAVAKGKEAGPTGEAKVG